MLKGWDITVINVPHKQNILCQIVDDKFVHGGSLKSAQEDKLGEAIRGLMNESFL